jgi:sigma-B regulation protein RsbU (phosphoserine phosphatase)
MELCASQIGFALEAARLYSRLNEYSRALDAELQKGRKIQRDFLPQELPSLDGWEIAASFHPALQVSGDFFDAFITGDGGLCLVIGDVCDKGIGSALFMALFRSLIRVFSSQSTPDGLAGVLPQPAPAIPAGSEAAIAWRAVSLTNAYIAREHGQEVMFATIFVGVLNAETGVISYVNAGHEAPLIIDASGVKHELKGTGSPVGILPDSRFRVEQARLQPGQTLIAYTDGVTEAFSPEGQLYTRKRFRSLLPSQPTTAAGLIARIETDVLSHTRNAPQSDDITMIVVRRKPEACDPRG